jgi:hypothetical protein
MNPPLLTLKLRTKRDLVVVRQRARQLAGLLGFVIQDQAALAAGVFALACQVAGEAGRGSVHFYLRNGTLDVTALPDARRRPDSVEDRTNVGLRLSKALPGDGPRLSPEDAAWAIQELNKRTPLRLFEEIQKLNQELLQTLHELAGCQRKSAVKKPRAA